MRELQNTEILAVGGASWGMVSFAMLSGITAGLGFAGLTNATPEAAFVMIMCTTGAMILIALP
jgi:hypothetical protein